ncbi:hypothetical protein GCM10012280_08110 [Wenjunlia tyrosinilytica]|uniref:Uncharacterized protein n=1 Tax=Wenjunlia tyrosinilytica TaxID=1544741 RepID=A0A918DSZ1_9ACTN|nr:hypothetical protein GCM10012280_08110 [Wenjunlia tyrosinilytica]
MRTRVPVALACGEYDRTEALRTGAVVPEGTELTYIALAPEEVFYRMLRCKEFDAAELSLSSYVMNLSRDGDFNAVPVLPSRTFRWWHCGGTSTKPAPGWRAPPARRSSSPGRRPCAGSARPTPFATRCLGCTRRSSAPARSWAPITGRTKWPPTTSRCGPSLGTRTNRG